jgi:beta-lactam-binding protein with PASTA domain
MTRISAGLPAVPLPKGDDAASSATTAKAIPDIRGLTVNDAVTLLMQNDLIPKIAPAAAPANPLYGKDVVVNQVPAPGSSYGYKQSVDITLSAGSETSIRIPAKK